MDGDSELTIGQVAQRSGVTASTIRYYESIGLLPAPERESGQRRYDAGVLGRLAFIGVAQEAGFTLREIGELMHGIDTTTMAEPMRVLSARKLPEIEALIDRAERMKLWLQAAKDCGCRRPDECALFPEPGQPVAAGDVTLTIVEVDGRGCRR
jgi:MerR family transcriptional regulator, redox-sensitive transcriptional activator SoxR